MIQLILDVGGESIALPESQKNGYIIREETLSESIPMISGRTVREYRGKVWVVSYQYGYFNDADIKKIIAACEKGMRQSIVCSALTQENETMISSKFIVTSYERPKFMWSRTIVSGGIEKNVPMWADFSVNLREVKPHA